LVGPFLDSLGAVVVNEGEPYIQYLTVLQYYAIPYQIQILSISPIRPGIEPHGPGLSNVLPLKPPPNLARISGVTESLKVSMKSEHLDDAPTHPLSH